MAHADPHFAILVNKQKTKQTKTQGTGSSQIFPTFLKETCDIS